MVGEAADRARGGHDAAPGRHPEGEPRECEEEEGEARAGEKKDKCGAALASGDAADIAKWCDVAKTDSKKLGEQEFKHADGKSAGKRTVTRTVLEFETPDQKGRPGAPPVDKWPSTKLKAFDQKTAHSPGPANGHSLSAAVLPSPADNDDRDCVDWISGARFGGIGVADGAPSSCYDPAGKLKATLSIGTAAGTCQHTNGSVFFGVADDGVEDDCWAARS